jgi:hypothetical protein
VVQVLCEHNLMIQLLSIQLVIQLLSRQLVYNCYQNNLWYKCCEHNLMVQLSSGQPVVQVLCEHNLMVQLLSTSLLFSFGLVITRIMKVSMTGPHGLHDYLVIDLQTYNWGPAHEASYKQAWCLLTAFQIGNIEILMFSPNDCYKNKFANYTVE